MTVRVVELFAGIGSQRMALTLMGIPHEVVAVSEIDKYALMSYEAIWGDCPNLGDITQVVELPPCDLVTYSFPCQDLSIAGERKGMGAGTRSGLVWEVLRLLDSAGDNRPEWLLMENVPLVFTAPEWPVLVSRLEAMGYRNKWALLDSSNFGSAQKRVRAFMISRLNRDPPDLPASFPNAPRLCMRDIMDPSREEKYIRRIPLEKVKFREGVPVFGNCTPQAEIEDIGGMYFKKSLFSSSSSSPTVLPFHGNNFGIKVFDYDGLKAVESRKDDGIVVLFDWDKPGELDVWRRIYDAGGQSPTIIKKGGHGVMTVPDASESIIEDGSMVVNVLTPLECWRLMGQPYWAYKRASSVCSDAQLYNLAGNSIVVEVLMALFSVMFGTKGARMEQSTLLRWEAAA